MRLRFTIRDLLWLIALVGLAVGWWLDRSGLQSDCDARIQVGQRYVHQLVLELMKNGIHVPDPELD
jgi:hypothetical protein